MVAEETPRPMSVDDYIALEETSEVKHEYVNGYVYAMSGGTLRHDTIANNIRAEIRAYLRASGRPCRIVGPDVRLQVSTGLYRYPDAMVVCDEALSDEIMQVSTPVLVVEVLSESTELTDRREKLAEYESISGLVEYVLIATQRRAVECFRRTDEGLWVHQRYGSENNLTLDAIDLTLPISTLYVDTTV